MRRKSKQEELRARALGSEMDSEAEASKDILFRGAPEGIVGDRGSRECGGSEEEGGGDWSWRCEGGIVVDSWCGNLNSSL